MKRSPDYDPRPPAAIADSLRALEVEPAPRPGEDARLQAWLEERVQQVPRERRQRRTRIALATGGLAAAAGVMLALGSPFAAPEPQPELATASNPVPGPVAAAYTAQVTLAPGHALTWVDAAGAEHRMETSGAAAQARQFTTAAAQAARLALTERLTVELGPNSRVLLSPEPLGTATAHASAQLAYGRVRVHVGGGEGDVSFHTPEGVVHIARQSTVTLAYRAERGRTCVEVVEGHVGLGEGASRKTLSARDRHGCDSAGWLEQTPARKRSARKAPLPTAASSLREQNRLLSEGLEAEREGNARRARKLFGTLLKRYPDSPLSPEAARGLSRVQD